MDEKNVKRIIKVSNIFGDVYLNQPITDRMQVVLGVVLISRACRFAERSTAGQTTSVPILKTSFLSIVHNKINLQKRILVLHYTVEDYFASTTTTLLYIWGKRFENKFLLHLGMYTYCIRGWAYLHHVCMFVDPMCICSFQRNKEVCHLP